jgi:hypothetical protein
MNPIEILGSLLGQKSSGSGKGADVLKDIFAGGSRRESPPESAPASASRELTEDDIERQARELEDLLNVANDRTSRRTTGAPASSQPPQPQSSWQPAPAQRASRQAPAQGAPRQGGWGPERGVDRPVDPPPDDAVSRQNEQATILVQAMVNAAKCDGQISQAEQENILSRLENPSPAAIQFLREEFSRPLDVREFAWSVPVGMEQQVYTMSLIAIDLDSDREEAYLRELAHGLRLAPQVCDQIKERLTGAGSRYVGAR